MLDSLANVLGRIQEIEVKFNSASSQAANADFASALQEAQDRSDAGSGTSDAKTLAAGSANGDYADLIQSSAQKYQLDPDLIKAVISVESNFRSDAKSSAGALGLMQLMPGTARGLGVTNALDPAQNIEAGSKYLRQMLDGFGSVELALAAYNAGPGNVKKYGGIPPFKETQNYVKKVLAKFNEFQIGTG
jgi:soluble lytic murein transglycosylase-like protein